MATQRGDNNKNQGWRVPQISLRAMFAIVSLVCLVFGLFWQWRAAGLAQKEAVLALRLSLSDHVTYDYEFDEVALVAKRQSTGGPHWLANYFGVDSVHCVRAVYLTHPMRERIWLLSKLRGLKSLSIARGVEEAEAWEELFRLKSLESLQVKISEEQDRGGLITGRLAELEKLRVFKSGLNSDQLARVLKHPQLEVLELWMDRIETEPLEPYPVNQRISSLSLFWSVDHVVPITKILDSLPNLKVLSVHLPMYLKPEQCDLSTAPISRLENLEELTIQGGITGNHLSLEHLPLKKLTIQEQSYSPMGDSGLSRLQGLQQLEQLNIVSSQISDAGMGYFGSMTQLKELQIGSRAISDLGLQRLAVVKKLRQLQIRSASVTVKGIQSLQDQLPNCRIIHLQ